MAMGVFLITTRGRTKEGRHIIFPLETRLSTLTEILLTLRDTGFVHGHKLMCREVRDGARIVTGRVEAAVFAAGIEEISVPTCRYIEFEGGNDDG